MTMKQSLKKGSTPQDAAAAASLSHGAAACRSAADHLVAAASKPAPRTFQEETGHLVKVAKRMQLVLDGVDGAATAAAAAPANEAAVLAAAAALAGVESALKRGAAAVSSAASTGPFNALFHDTALRSEFLNCATDLGSALSKLSLADLGVSGPGWRAADVEEDVQLAMSQLRSLTLDPELALDRAKLLIELRAYAEAMRTRSDAPGSQPPATSRPSPSSSPSRIPAAAPAPLHPPHAFSLLESCSVQAIAADQAYLQEQAERAVHARNWVDAFLYKRLLEEERQLLPGNARAGAQGGTAAGGTQRAGARQQQAAVAEPEAEEFDDGIVDPVEEVRTLLQRLIRPKLSLEQRLAVLQPLAAAAGLAPPVPGTNLHSGAVLFALTDPECAQMMVDILRSGGDLPAEIKLWVLSLILSLVHPERGLNPRTQDALMQTGLPLALCRLMINTSTPPDQRLQCLAMMRVLVCDVRTHELLMQNKVVPAIVKQIGEVRLINGRFECKPSTTTSPTKKAPGGVASAGPAAAAGAGSGVAFDINQQMTQLAILMISDLGTMKGHLYKADILQSGAVSALAMRLSDPGSHEQVRVAAAKTLGVLMADGAIAVEAARSDVLVGLVDMLTSGSAPMAAAAAEAVQSLLTPTMPTSLATATSASLGGPRGGSGGGGGNAAAQADAAALGESTLGGLSTDDIMAAMGHAFTPAATSSLLELVVHGDPSIAPLAFALLPLSATDAACRAAILSSARGVEAVMAAAVDHKSKGHRAAVATLGRLAEDSKLKVQVAALLGRAVADCHRDPAKVKALAKTIAEIGTPRPGLQRDSQAASRAASFAAELVEARALPMLVELVERGADADARMAGVRALAPMCMYGEQVTREALLAANVPMALVECTKAAPTSPPSSNGDDLLQAACEALSGLTNTPDMRQQIFGHLLGQLGADAVAARTCRAIRIVAGTSPECYELLAGLGGKAAAPGAADEGAGAAGKAGGKAGKVVTGPVARVVELVSRAPDRDALAQPTLLLCCLARWSPAAGEQALKAGAAPALMSAMERGSTETKVAAAACCGFLARHDDRARDGLARAGLLPHLVTLAKEVPSSVKGVPVLWWEEAMVALSTMATLHEPSRSAAASDLYLMLNKGSENEVTAAALVVSYMARGAKGRELVMQEGLAELIVTKALEKGPPRAKAYAADAIGHLSVTATVTLPGKTKGEPEKKVDPKVFFVNKGAVEQLVGMLAMTAADDAPEEVKRTTEQCVFEAADSIEILAGSTEALARLSRCRASEALHDVVLRGKKGKVSQRTATAAYNAYVRVLGDGGGGGGGGKRK